MKNPCIGRSNMDRLRSIHTEQLRISQQWAMMKDYDEEHAKQLRKEALLINHSRYLEKIPVYKKMAKEEGIDRIDDLETIKKYLMFTDDVFKSYDQSLLDNNDFAGMNEWLSSIFHERINVDVRGVKSIDEWIGRLAPHGINLCYSSGTSGRFSFIPRCSQSWELLLTAPICYCAPYVTSLGITTFIENIVVRLAVSLLDPFRFAGIARDFTLPGYDGIFLSFQRGNMGIQMVAQELSKVFKNSFFLYDMDISASAIRIITRGARNEEERKMVENFYNETIVKSKERYRNIIEHLKESARKGRKVLLFGAPYQFKELVELVREKEGSVKLKKGSMMMTGGGWKSFEGNKIERKDLTAMIRDTFDVPEKNIRDGYSMTEVNSLILVCEHGRYHLPPIIEPVILDDNFIPMEGENIYGRLGFLDPFAVSYPGFIITGDNVRYHYGKCDCGMYGAAFSEITRAPGREIKGCGGIMTEIASIKA